MKRSLLLLVLACGLIGTAAAERHPKAAEIEALIAKNPIDPRIPEMTRGIRAESLALNTQGYEAYEQKRYEAALEKFKQAISADDGNSLSYYNAACVMALSYAALPGTDRLPSMEMTILRYLKQAIERHWYWGLWMMVDSDLDAVRRFSWDGSVDGLRITLGDDPEWGDVYNVLHGDGTVTNFTNRQSGMQLRQGYFSIIAGHVLQYLPQATPRAGSPPVSNVTSVIPIDGFQRLPSPR